jgi:hypothetical protein
MAGAAAMSLLNRAIAPSPSSVITPASGAVVIAQGISSTAVFGVATVVLGPVTAEARGTVAGA